MKSLQEINRELVELDIEFESPENQKSGKLKYDQWAKRRAELLQSRDHAWRLERLAPKPAASESPAVTRAQLDAILRLPEMKGLSDDERREYEALQRDFYAATDRGDIDAARAIENNERRKELAHTVMMAHFAGALREGYTGAKSFPALMIGVLGVIYGAAHDGEMASIRRDAEIEKRRHESGKAFAQIAGEEVGRQLKALKTEHAREREELVSRINELEQGIEELRQRSAEPGPPGMSAYHLAVEHGYAGTESQWLDSLSGPPGRDAPEFNEVVEAVVRLMPTPRDGRDGVPLDDFDMTLEGRTLALSFTCGERVVRKETKVPFPVYLGVYRSGTKAEQGDAVTFGGSLWIALRDTDKSPPSDDWQLAVRRGQNGKDAR